jgi:type I restriction enzyme S subunit
MELLSSDGAIDVTNQQPFEDISPGLTLFEEGDVLFAKITPCMENGKGALVRELPTRYAFGSTEFHVLRSSKKVNGPFLYYATLNPIFRAYAAENMVGAAGQKRVSSRFLKDTRVPLPPLPEQQRIAAYLDATCAAIDGAVSAKSSQLETLDALRKTTVTRAVTRGIDDKAKLEPTGNVWMENVPRGWSLVCLKRMSEIQTGLTLGKAYDGPLIERPYLRVANVQDGHLDLDDVTLIEVPTTVAARVELRAGDVLMTEGGDLDKLGRGYLWNGQIPNCLHQNHIFAVRCFPHKLRPMFLAYATTSQYGRDYFEATGKRTTNLASTNSTKVGLFPIPLPALTIQDEICHFLDAKLGELERMAGGITAQIETLTAYRKSLIHECVTGQRRVTEEDLQRSARALEDAS